MANTNSQSVASILQLICIWSHFVLYRDKLPLVNAYLHENLRYLSLTPFLVPHMTIRDTDVAGYKVSTFTNVIWAKIYFPKINGNDCHGHLAIGWSCFENNELPLTVNVEQDYKMPINYWRKHLVTLQLRCYVVTGSNNVITH